MLGGYSARVAYDGLTGLLAAREAPPDCLVPDISMPGMDGYTVAGRVRADPRLRAAKLVAFSGRGGEDYEQRCAEAGFDHVLTEPTKPARLEELFRALAATVRLAETTGVSAGQTKELLEEVREELRELKQDVQTSSRSGGRNRTDDAPAKVVTHRLPTRSCIHTRGSISRPGPTARLR